MLNNFLRGHVYRLSQFSSCGSNITIHPLKNIMNVSVLGGWCSTEPPGALAQHWGSSGDATWDVAVGAPAGGRNTGLKGPHAEEKALSSSTLVLVTGPRNYQVAGEHPLLCQRCVISLREVVPSEQKAMTTHYSTLAWKNPKTERPGRLQAMGSLRVRPNGGTSLSLFTFLNWRRKLQPTPVFLPGVFQLSVLRYNCHCNGTVQFLIIFMSHLIIRILCIFHGKDISLNKDSVL